jgi:23S rRNA pseudouridine1911/1915/1917 synthase
MSFEIEKSFTTEKYVVSYPVCTEHDNLRLDQFVMTQMPTLSRQFLKKKIDRGEIIISDRKPPHKPSVKVHVGERVTVTTHNDGMIEDEYWRGEVVPRDQDPTIVFEDNGLLVINKPPFMITHPAGKNLFYCATVFYETIYKHTMHSIHRLDRETSGILMLGKNPKVAQKVSLLFEEAKIRKCYFLIAEKLPNAKAFPFTAKERLGRDDNAIPRGLINSYPEDSEEGKDAETHFELVLEKDGYVLALAFPLSGRQHQIRVHAACNGYPLLGDKLYNGDSSVFIRFKDFEATDEDHEKMQIPRQALHAVALKLSYPADDMQHFIAPLPKDLKDWIETKLSVSDDEIEMMIKQKVEAFLV